MFQILNDEYLDEYLTTGFVDTDCVLSHELVEDIRSHYRSISRNDLPRFFAQNEHQIQLEGKEVSDFFATLPPDEVRQRVQDLYTSTYGKAIYADQTLIPRVAREFLRHDFQRFFKTRFFIISYDIHLANDHNNSGAGIHADTPNFHHFYETENDLTFYIPLVDINVTSGGRLGVLPEKKHKLCTNVLLKILEETFSKEPWLDSKDYIVPEKITDEELREFVASPPYKKFMEYEQSAIHLARSSFCDDFNYVNEPRGKVLLFNNKAFHSAEAWRETSHNRELYIVRCMPIYDTKIRLKQKLLENKFNRHLLDFEKGELLEFDDAVDLTQIPQEHKLPLSGCSLPEVGAIASS